VTSENSIMPRCGQSAGGFSSSPLRRSGLVSLSKLDNLAMAPSDVSKSVHPVTRDDKLVVKAMEQVNKQR
jgi:hypothetical protein